MSSSYSQRKMSGKEKALREMRDSAYLVLMAYNSAPSKWNPTMFGKNPKLQEAFKTYIICESELRRRR